MAKGGHSIIFGLKGGLLADVLKSVRDAVQAAQDLQSTGEYFLTLWTKDRSDAELVAWRTGLAHDALPVVEEPAASFNQVSFTVHAATPTGVAVEAGLVLVSHERGVLIQLVFVRDILEDDGAGWIIKTLDRLVPALGFDSAILSDTVDEAAISRRVAAGESLTTIISARIRGLDELPPPLLAMVKAERTEPDLWDVARDRGVNVRMTPKGFVVFLTVDL